MLLLRFNLQISVIVKSYDYLRYKTKIYRKIITKLTEVISCKIFLFFSNLLQITRAYRINKH